MKKRSEKMPCWRDLLSRRDSSSSVCRGSVSYTHLGAVYAVLESVAKIVANGGDYSKIRLTFQEYFRRMTEDPSRWSQPFAALLGAYDVQLGLGLPSIGGKDSMSGTFQDIDVPPTRCV